MRLRAALQCSKDAGDQRACRISRHFDSHLAGGVPRHEVDRQGMVERHMIGMVEIDLRARYRRPAVSAFRRAVDGGFLATGL